LEDKMRNTACLAAALAVGLLAAGCTQDAQYPTTGYRAGYTATQSPASTSYTGYVTPTRTSSARYWNSARRDTDRDGIPNRYDRDANGDRVADRYQGR
jgi:hypothetical protein